MKRIQIPLLLLLTAMCAVSCELFALDNYDAPSEILYGSVVDASTGAPVLTDQGSEGIRVRLMETSWEGNVTPQDFYCKPDGTFRNARLFEADYNIRVDGPFVPLVIENAEGTLMKDESVNIHLKGEQEVKFEVQPFLNVEITSAPQVSAGKVMVRVKVTRATSRAELKQAISPSGDWKDTYANITDLQLFVSYSSTVGYRARDSRWSSSVTYDGSSFDKLLGTDVTLKSNGTIPSGQKVFIRAAARINYDTPRGSGTRRWNYSEIMEVNIP